MINKFSYINRVAIGLLAIAIVLLQPGSSIAKDKDDLSDAHALGPYDEVSCNGATEDELDTGDPNEDFFPPFEMNFSSSDSSSGGGFFGGGGGANLTGGFEFPFSDQEVFQKFNRDSEASSEPTAILNITPTDVQEGEEISVIASLADFADTGGADNQKFAVGFSVDDISLMGIMAGGEKLPESPTGSACGEITRTPTTDEDGDGMDDDWERVYGLNPADPSDADDDPDLDSASDFFQNTLGENLQVTAPTSAGETGLMTNLAEYILDTNPLRADTDKDGITDGLEVIGLSTGTVTFKNTRPVGSALKIRGFVVGVSTMEDSSKDRARIVKLDSTVKTVHVGNGEKLHGTAETLKDFYLPGETVIIDAKFVGTQAEPDSFAYTYTIDGQEVQNPSSARHRLEYQLDPDEISGQEIPFVIEAINPATGQKATLRGVIRVGERILLESTPISPIAGEAYTVQSLLTSGDDPSLYLYEWAVDGDIQEELSGVGKTSISLVAPLKPGEEIDIALRLYSVDTSQIYGNEEMIVEVATPIVTLDIVPDKPIVGDTITVLARPENFPLNLDTDNDGENDATVLEYRWTVNDIDLPIEENAAGLSTIEVQAQENLIYEVEMVVTSFSLRETAEDQIAFTADVGEIPISDLQKRQTRFLASLINNTPAFAGVTGLGLLGLASVLSYKYWFKGRRRT